MGTFDGIRNLMIGAALVLAGSTAQADFSAADVYREAASAVVVIFGFDSRGNGSSGTGSVVTRDGLVLTNNHVIYDPKTKGTYANIRVVSPVPQREPAQASVPPSAQDQPHEFTGPSGEKMYGVPDHDFDLMGAHKAVYEAAVKHANDAFDELDSQF